MRYNGAGRTACVARLSARPTSATCPPDRAPGPLQGLLASGFTWTARPSLRRRVLLVGWVDDMIDRFSKVLC